MLRMRDVLRYALPRRSGILTLPTMIALSQFRAFSRHASIRIFLAIAIVLAVPACATLQSVSAVLLDRISFTGPQLQSFLDRHYPREYDQLGGLITLSVMNPQISIPAQGGRLHLDFDVGIDGLGLRSDRTTGHFAVTSGLRYDPATRGLYLDAPVLESAELPLLGGRINASGRDLINGWLRDYAKAEPVYRFDSTEIDKLGKRRVTATSIEDGRVIVRLED